ncbi:tetratricopeptide repeat protein [Flavihumibacter stibioxidans]|uniref:Tetratricopeptide repeat protein n=1 Tax=Flavihumibacter stibioxidans TaxID=1834163 RepID=A0ABR7MDM3_9BACT|nr:tetratricopeptide repeat protein [Flavihumibacter stibioxidans]MBC6493130.1 hypothetical protein [Flavihumibacter stibioxidans]
MDRIQKLKAFLAEAPSDSFLKHALALELIKLGDEMQARELFEQILEKDPEYIGTYYHLARLLERAGDIQAAITCYQKGMDAAGRAGDQHAFGELRSALEELTF